ncbi:MetQ/NlpA family ABC transporter substrate-binding protein [Lactovum miscens]|uniref:D-methionine transport system substrate-binding protein n=1 Tax=Lactovum miscens TaxID=190387 RepID=A0A841C768_9LACT|nr:MetQ/NlpA family ABC transporter substrate-binding protein [Lactovum miscens]MBB5887239.1 D-methionine transport system substrate-binding protein [Lactovum miscens]
MSVKRIFFKVTLAIIAVTALVAVGTAVSAGTRNYTLGVGGSAEKAEWTQVAKDVKKDGINLKIIQVNDYTTANPATEDGSFDLNAFQHTAFLNDWNKSHNGDLVSVGYTYISPFGLYSKKIHSYKDLKDGDIIAVPNDPTNEGRALQLLDAIGVIKLKSNAPATPTLKDIKTYVKKITIKPIQGDQEVVAMPDVTAACINTNFVIDQLHQTPKDALYVDTDHGSKVNNIYKNILVTKKSKVKNADFKKLINAYQSNKVAKIIKKEGDIPAWNLK